MPLTNNQELKPTTETAWQTNKTETATTPNKSETHSTITIWCDGSYYYRKNMAAVGYVLTTISGNKIEENRCEAEPATNILETEAFACLEAIKASLKYNPEYILIYTDNKKLEQQLTTNPPHEINDIYIEIKNMIDKISRVSIKHTPRHQNEEAHTLANSKLREMKKELLD